MIRLLTAFLSGIAVALVGSWLWSAKQSLADDADHPQVAAPQLKGVEWFARVDGFAELIHKAPGLANTLSEAEKVTVFRVVEGAGDIEIGQYTLGKPYEATTKEAAAYSRVMCSPTSVTDVSACLFSPGFGIEFVRGESEFYALVCYSCSDILFFDREGQTVGGFGMTREAEAALAGMLRTVYPDDTEVQTLSY